MALCNGLTYVTPLNGSIVFSSGFVQYYNKIVVNSGQMLLDVSAFGSPGNYQVMIPGIKKLSGQASGFLDTAQGGNIFGSNAFSCGTVTIHFDIGCSIEFGCYIGESTISETYEGTADVTTNFAFSDVAAPTVVWNES